MEIIEILKTSIYNKIEFDLSLSLSFSLSDTRKLERSAWVKAGPRKRVQKAGVGMGTAGMGMGMGKAGMSKAGSMVAWFGDDLGMI